MKKGLKHTRQQYIYVDEHKAGLGSSYIITIRRGQMSVSRSIFSRSRGLGGLVRYHLLVNYYLHVQVLEVYSRRMFDQVPTKELKALVVPAEEYSVVLLSLLESFDGLGSNGLQLLLSSLELLILLLCDLSLRSEVVP